ncbi:MAG: hypothetical protein AB2669_16580 [Candidatus Thiodiazotropha endolucinida]
MTRLALAILLSLSNTLAAEEYYFAQGLFFQSVIKSEAQKDRAFDEELRRRNMSTSTVLFDDQPARRYGANIGKGYRDGIFLVEGSIYVDPAAEIVFKNPEFGESHMRTDAVGVTAMGGMTFSRVDIKAGLHVTYQEADVHNWVLNTAGELHREEHETFRDLSAGLAIGLNVRVYKAISVGCLYLKDIGDVDKIGTDNQLGCGVGYRF